MLAIIVFVFMSVSVALAYGQTLHAERLNVDVARLQALYAAEAGVYAALDAGSDIPETALFKDDRGEATFTATRSAASEPYWITSVGKAAVRGDQLEATVRGYVVGHQVVLWDF